MSPESENAFPNKACLHEVDTNFQEDQVNNPKEQFEVEFIQDGYVDRHMGGRKDRHKPDIVQGLICINKTTKS